jgi:N-acetylmuramoyl-L-alanine amidase
MAVVKATTDDVRLLARLMRAEAEADGKVGMLLVGNVGINRVLAECKEFKNIRTIRQMVFQRPGGFEATLYSYFYKPARSADMRLARRTIKGEKFYPAEFALWFFDPGKNKPCPATWYGQPLTDRYKGHCFFQPTVAFCPNFIY